jgi:methoxymalonate biosynthesis acyl carrier protein
VPDKVDNTMLERKAIQSRIATLFSEKLRLKAPPPEADLFKTQILDSLKFVVLLVELEKVFGTRVSLEDLEVDNFRSIERIAEYVASRTSTNESTSSNEE